MAKVKFEALDMAIESLSQESSEDVISRQSAIDAIMCEPTDAHYPSWYAERLEQLPSAQPEQRWIPWSSGKLPEESGTYTVTAYDGVNKRVTYAKYQKRLNRWELTGVRAYWRVLAWMPLPEPYRPEGSRDENKT